MKTEQITVYIQFSKEEVLVGKMILDNKQVHFKYDENFIRLGLDLSPIKLKLDTSIQTAHPNPFDGLFGVFDDSLPDGWGKLLLNRALEAQGLSLNQINILDQLAHIGDTGKGALNYYPAIKKDKIQKKEIDLDRLKTAMDEVYFGTSKEVIAELMLLGGSSGGARPKANVGYNPKTNELMHGYNTLPDGFEHWIIKFPSETDPADIANIEYAYYKMAQLAHIPMSECTLLESTKGLNVFATKRFDRIGNDRIHMHSMAGLTHDNFRLSNIDYGHIIDVAYRLERTATAREAVLRLAAFNIYSHNLDDHSKNFSWLMDATGKWTLAPAYDLTFSSNPYKVHSTSVSGVGANPGRKQIIELANEFSIKKPEEIIHQMQSAIGQWPVIAKSCGVSKSSTERIQSVLVQLKD